MQALAELEYPGKLQRLLLTPEREVLVELVITKDNGEIETFNAYRVQHSNSRGPYKGGLRYHPQVDLDDVRRRAPTLSPSDHAPHLRPRFMLIAPHAAGGLLDGAPV